MTGEVDYSQADGSMRHADVVVTGLKDDTGQVVSVVVEGAIRPSASGKRRALGKRAAVATMAEALPNLVWTDPPNGQCDWLSSQWGKYTGIPENDLLGLRGSRR